MRAFAKSILNYFAAYTETRFRFSRKLPFEWTEDALTLDMYVFTGSPPVAGRYPWTCPAKFFQKNPQIYNPLI